VSLLSPCLREPIKILTYKERGERLDSEVVWIFTEPSAILVIPTSLLRTVVFVLFKEAHFYAELLPVTPRCASRGFLIAFILKDGLFFFTFDF
jgi:hypothetical protein